MKETIINFYKETQSLRATAEKSGFSYSTVRKILITEGVYDSDRYAEISRLLSKGYAIDDVAKTIGVSAKTVKSYLPYTKGTYLNPDKTVNAMRIRKSREKTLNEK